MGSSGTVKACHLAIQELGFDNGISYQAMQKLQAYLIGLGEVRHIKLTSIKAHRQSVFPAGVAELLTIMQVLEIDRLEYSDGALREGVMYDMLGRQNDENVQARSVQALAERYSVSPKQATLVASTCQLLAQSNATALKLTAHAQDLLRYAAQLHEIGLAISHSNYHQHTSYLLKWSDMFGFSRADQEKLACLALYQRRKLKADQLPLVQAVGGDTLVAMCLLLRLGVLAHQSRSRHSAPITLAIKGDTWKVEVGSGNHQALLVHQLLADVNQFAKWNIRLVVTMTDGNNAL
mgnify:FL=1